MSSHVRYSGVGTPRKWRSNKEEGIIKPILKPMAVFLVGGLLALGHHFFNSYADKKPLDFPHAPSQVWMNRIGTAFAFGFKAALSTTLSFVLSQLTWLTLRRKFLTFSEIDTVYLTANRDVLAAFLSSSILNSPLLVLTVAVSFLLLIPSVFAPSSLQVISGPNRVLPRSCQVPTGNLTNGSPGSTLYQTGGFGYWTGITPVAQKLAYSTFIGQKIPQLPQPCGINCTYSVSVPSIAFQCKDGVDLPAAMTPATPTMYWEEAFWNATATVSGSPPASFYVYWKSTTRSGTNGTALCTVGTANYDFTIQNVNGQQSVSYNVTHTGDLPNTVTDAAALAQHDRNGYNQAMQLSSIVSATRSLFLGSVSVVHTINADAARFNSPVVSGAFSDNSLNSGTEFTWGDVPRGIERLSHNVSAAILTMDLGVKDSTCTTSRQDIIYEYNRLNLWLPYGAALLIVSLCLIPAVIVFLKLNPENLTASFSDTVNITRNPTLNTAAWKDSDSTMELRFRLGKLNNGDSGFGLREEMRSE